jgi:hypothetical protein
MFYAIRSSQIPVLNPASFFTGKTSSSQQTAQLNTFFGITTRAMTSQANEYLDEPSSYN